MPHPNIRSLGILLRRKRKALGLSAAEVGRRAGINASSVWRIEEGQRAKPTADVLQAIGTALDIPASDLFATAGWVPKRDLPTFRSYLRAKYNLPAPARRELETKFDQVVREYGAECDLDQSLKEERDLQGIRHDEHLSQRS